MNTRLIFSRFTNNPRVKFSILLALWCLGFLLGILFSISFSGNYFQLLQTAFSAKPSPVLIFLVMLLPVVCTASAIYYRVFFLSCLLCFFNALCRGLCGMLIFMVFGGGAWLARTLLLFPGMCTAVFIWWLFVRHCTCTKPTFYKDVRFSITILSVLSVVDIYFLSPLLNDLSKYF